MSEGQNKLLNRRSATELANLIRTKAVSPVELLQAYLDAISQLNPSINAICTLAAEQALEAAKKSEAAVMRCERLGPLPQMRGSAPSPALPKMVRAWRSDRVSLHSPRSDRTLAFRLRRSPPR